MLKEVGVKYYIASTSFRVISDFVIEEKRGRVDEEKMD